MMYVRPPLVNVMAKAAEKAARGLVRDFGEVEHLQISRKGPADFVSTADTNAQNIIREELARARPDFGFLMEEKDSANETSENVNDGSLTLWTERRILSMAFPIGVFQSPRNVMVKS